MLRISFKLGDADLQHFEQVAQQTQAIARTLSAQAIIEAARAMLDQAEQAQLAQFVKERFSRLRLMLEMVSVQMTAKTPPVPPENQPGAVGGDRGVGVT